MAAFGPTQQVHERRTEGHRRWTEGSGEGTHWAEVCLFTGDTVAEKGLLRHSVDRVNEGKGGRQEVSEWEV